ncbi:MAG: Diaminopimelate decarboxylase [Candidatus Magnetoglobus multicellularis str. Araruama]|uniref:Diaminopimelate decarboxylase n=1 Tax=Candidatus Magnetoglobus multicellularis str. Araruama TaxID=890399 RepID=A0A1V1PDQ4_9BACT|nr:MAG: Diaminopimelate decarboxylase [Candidatus Magnetoglobus multicellularis str. Araruama]
MSKKIYVKPSIKKQESGRMNKFGSVFHRNYRDSIDGAKIDDIVANHGSPVFVISETAIRNQYRTLYREFSSKYPQVQFTWSYKTNYLDAVCCVFHQEGEIAEVVSEFEYQKARRLGVPGNKIIYNGPLKSKASLTVAFEENAIVNLDNFDEVLRAEEIASNLGKKVDVGIRLNMDTGIYPQWSRFGFNLENQSAYEAAKRIHMSKHLSLNGLHSHIGTFILEPSAYAVQVKKMVELRRSLETELDISIDYLDFGGGFPSKNKLKGTYLPPEISVPPLENYIDAITSTLLSNLSPEEYPTVYMETGRGMIDEAGYLITTVEGVKRMPDGLKSYIIDAGVNILYTSNWYNYKVELDRAIPGNYENAIIYGPLCMNIDIVLENASLPPLPKGTRLILSPMGAYNVTQWMQFISYRPAIVMVMDDGSVEQIRRPEILDDIVGPETIPEKLRDFKL